MTFRTILLSAIAATVIIACGSGDPVKKIVQAHLAETAGVEASEVEIRTINDPVPWTGADSMAYLQEYLESEKEVIIGHLEAAIEMSQEAIDKAEEVKEGGFPALHDMADQTIAESQMTIEMAEASLEAINTDYVNSPLEDLSNRVQSWEDKKEEVLYKVVSGTYSLQSEDGEMEFKLMTDPEVTTVIGSVKADAAEE